MFKSIKAARKHNTMDHYEEPSTYIHGVGNEVIIFLMICTIVWATIGIYIYYKICHNRNATIEAILSDEFRSLIRTQRSENTTDNNNDNASLRPPSRNYGNENCPICLDTLSNISITTNCGHVFDLTCFGAFWEHQYRTTNLSCPCCRTRVNMIHPNFDIAQFPREFQHVGRYNRSCGGIPRTFSEIIFDMPELIRQLRNAFFSRDLLSIAFKLRICCLGIIGFLYLLSPLDLIPEVIFGIFGYVDDILLWFIVLWIMTSQFRNRLQSLWND